MQCNAKFEKRNNFGSAGHTRSTPPVVRLVGRSLACQGCDKCNRSLVISSSFASHVIEVDSFGGAAFGIAFLSGVFVDIGERSKIDRL
jgi:hypothetical protein